MSRVLEALRTLQSRQQVGAGLHLRLERYELARKAMRPVVPIDVVLAEETAAPPLSPAPEARKCVLPTAPVVSDYFLDLAARISGQLAEHDCNVLLFVSPDHQCGSLFSLTHLAQAFSLQSDGDVLLVDGELRCGRLSQTVGVIAPGMTEVMLGTAAWPEVIHPTATPRIDFAPCGSSEIPSFERPGFGWNELRPKYRAALIGLADVHEPETTWLAAHCDATYFVISRLHSRRQAATEALNRLRSGGASVLGCIVVA